MNSKLLITGIILISCVPPPGEDPSPDLSEYLEDCEPCALLLNFASSNYQNRDWRGAIDNYDRLLKCNCGKEDPENTYKYMAYSYQQLNLLDSAAYIFKQGMKFTPEDIELLKMAGENSGRLSLIDEQIYYFEKILSIEEKNIEILELLSNVFRDQGMFEEQVNILNIWLKYDPANKNANAEKKAAFSALGRDETDVDRERWESDPSNIQYGLDFIISLQDSGNDEKVIEVCMELLTYEKYNKSILQNLGDAYLNLYQEDNALNTYNTLAKVDPANYKVAIDISKILTDKDQYSEALEWAEKAVNASAKKGAAIYQRGEVYYSVAESCSAEVLTFWDRVVYEIAWKDYAEAFNKGFSQAKSRRDFLGENNITTSSDWFMRPEDETEVTPRGKCYSWINKSVKRK